MKKDKDDYAVCEMEMPAAFPDRDIRYDMSLFLFYSFFQSQPLWQVQLTGQKVFFQAFQKVYDKVHCTEALIFLLFRIMSIYLIALSINLLLLALRYVITLPSYLPSLPIIRVE